MKDVKVKSQGAGWPSLLTSQGERAGLRALTALPGAESAPPNRERDPKEPGNGEAAAGSVGASSPQGRNSGLLAVL